MNPLMPPPVRTVEKLDDMVERLRQLQADAPRTIVGLCGPPGVGKSTIAQALVDRLGDDAAVVPMDGFHLANAVLREQGLDGLKGAASTFDVAGYAVALERLAAPAPDTVYLPAFDRSVDEAIAGALAIPASTRLVITEGNYLLLPDPSWRRARVHMDEVWFLRVDDEVRRRRLVARHRFYGRGEQEAADWVDRVDEANARHIKQTAVEADLVVGLPSDDFWMELT